MRQLYLDCELFTGPEEEFLAIEKFFCKGWWLNYKIHRDDGPALIWPDGTQHWYQNGLRHRINGPAIIRSDGYQAWCQNGQLHRTNGPAVIYSNGYREYGINGYNLTNFFPMDYWFDNSCTT